MTQDPVSCDGCGSAGPTLYPGNRCNHVNRIFTVLDEDRSPDDRDGISIELPMQLIRDSAMALQPELTPDWMAHGSE